MFSSGWLSNLVSLLNHVCVHLMGRYLFFKIGYGIAIGRSAGIPAASPFLGIIPGLAWDTNESGDILDSFDGPGVLQSI